MRDELLGEGLDDLRSELRGLAHQLENLDDVCQYHEMGEDVCQGYERLVSYTGRVEIQRMTEAALINAGAFTAAASQGEAADRMVEYFDYKAAQLAERM